MLSWLNSPEFRANGNRPEPGFWRIQLRGRRSFPVRANQVLCPKQPGIQAQLGGILENEFPSLTGANGDGAWGKLPSPLAAG